MGEVSTERPRIPLLNSILHRTAPLVIKKAALYALLLAVAAVMAVPFVWILLTALKGSENVFAFPPNLIPDEWRFYNFVETWRVVPFGAYMLNSIIVSAATVGFNVLFSSLAAYPLARMDFPGKTFFFLLILSTLMVPQQVIMIPLYTLTLKLGLVNTLAGVILPFSVNAFGVFLMRQFYLNIPQELEDAAIVDGCSPLRVWWHVLVPLSKPAIATLTVFTFVGAWSQFLWPLIILQDQEQFTLPVGLSYLTGAFSANFKYVAAGAIITIIPVLVLYYFMQRYFIRGILAGGVKG